MSQMKRLQEIVTGLHSLADSISELAAGLEDPEPAITHLSIDPIPEIVLPPPNPNPEELLPEIRKVLAEKGFAGKNAEVRSLLSRYGAHKLSMVDSLSYPELLREAKEL